MGTTKQSRERDRKLRAALRIYSGGGLTLKRLSDEQHLDTDIKTLRNIARAEGLSFPDIKKPKAA